MTSGLRKAHKFMWLFLGALGMVLIVASIKSVKQSLPLDKNISAVEPVEGFHIVQDNADWLIQIKEATPKNKVDIIVKRPLKSASTGVYTTSSNQEREAFLGSMDKKGVYSFEVDKTVTNIQLFDAIKNTTIQNIELSWE